MRHYDYFDKLTIPEFDAVMELALKQSSQRIKVLDTWMDDNTYCIDVRFSTWKEDVVKCTFTGLALSQVAAFFYPESPVARKVLQDLFEAQYPK